jgi:hypothetical protein
MDMFKMMKRNYSCYSIFVEKFVSCVIGTNSYKSKKLLQTFQSFCSVSDEAMTFLILENNWDVWSEIGAAQSGTEKKPMKLCEAKQKFFDPKTGRGYSWNQAGKLYYNMMYDLVKEDCARYGNYFDQQLLTSFKTMNEEGQLNKKELRRKQIKPQMIVACKSDYVPKASRAIGNVNYLYNTHAQGDGVMDQVTNQTNI